MSRLSYVLVVWWCGGWGTGKEALVGLVPQANDTATKLYTTHVRP